MSSWCTRRVPLFPFFLFLFFFLFLLSPRRPVALRSGLSYPTLVNLLECTPTPLAPSTRARALALVHLLGEFMAGPGKQYVVRLSAWLFDPTLQQFPIGMGTGAVYVTLSGLKSHSQALTTFETIFYFLNITLFLLNSVTLALQAIRASSVVHASGITNKASPSQCTQDRRGAYSRILSKESSYPSSYVTVASSETTDENLPPLGPVFCHHHHRHHKLRRTNWTCASWIHLQFILVSCNMVQSRTCRVTSDIRVYVSFALIVCFPMLMIWFNKPHDLTTFTPAWAFLVFPLVRFTFTTTMSRSKCSSLRCLSVSWLSTF